MYKTILLATDMGDLAQQTAQQAREIAQKYDANLHIVHVIEPIPNYGYPNIGEMQEALFDEARNALSDMAAEFSIPADNQHIEAGSIKAHVVDRAREIKADLIIVGSHGKHGLVNFLGSTANAILNAAECDVLTVRAVEEE